MLTRVWSPSIGDTPPAVIAGPYTLTATRDPLATDDTSSGWTVGSIWFNATAGYLRWWDCRDATVGAAKWVFGGADYANGGTNPSAEVSQFGSGLGIMYEEGNGFRYASAGINPAGTAGNYCLSVFSLPANSFDGIGNRGVNLTAMGSVANNTNVKTISLYYNCTTAVVGSTITGGTLIATTGAYSTAGAAAWQMVANVYKYGVANSNTQIALHETVQVGATLPALTVPTALTATENGPILLAVTGNAATTAADIVLNLFAVNMMN